MKRFRFDLEAVLRLARFEYDRELAELGGHVREVQALREREAYLREVLVNETTRREDASLASLSQAYRATLADGVRRVEVEISRATAQLRECRQRLALKRQRRDSVERLEEKRHESWRLETARQEQLELEELASMRSFVRSEKR